MINSKKIVFTTSETLENGGKTRQLIGVNKPMGELDIIDLFLVKNEVDRLIKYRQKRIANKSN